MKKKNFSLIMVFFISLFIGIYSVFAESNPSCKYVNTDGSGETITATIYLSREGISSYATINTKKYGPIIEHNGYNNIMVGTSWPFTNEDYETAIQYWQGTKKENYKDANKRCPDYFYACNTSDGVKGLFSDKSPDVFNVGVCDVVFESDALEITQNEKGEFQEKEERYSCTLSSPYVKDFSLNVEINYTKKDISFSTSKGVEETEYVKNFNYSKKNEPPTDLKVCYNIFEKSNSTNFSNYYVYPKSDTTFENKYSDSVVCYDLTSNVENEVGGKFCDVFQKKLEVYNVAIRNKEYNSAKKSINHLKSYCKSIVGNTNYDDYEYSCISMCLNINHYLPKEETSNDRVCGFSEKLIIYIANIVKWGKYLIPVIVIVLGILDFIKAISADKDDEMKKAQGRFVKRLIAAALIFILPFIIEFVLDKMGFGSNGCGIIDL